MSFGKILRQGARSRHRQRLPDALLARRAATVDSVEIIPEFAAFGAKNPAAHSIENIRLHVGDTARGWPGKYDVIVLTGSTPVLAQSFFATLNPSGRLLAITGDAPVMKAMLYTASGGNEIGSVALFETCIAPLTNAPQPEGFVF